MDFNTTPPNFSLQYNAGTSDIGSGYAAGITQAGKSISDASLGVMDIMRRNQNASDMLNAMQQTKMMTPDQYNAIAGKSLDAKEKMLGMYASEWALQQAQSRELQKQGYAGNVDIAVAHQKLLDTLAANRIPPSGTNTTTTNNQAPKAQPVTTAPVAPASGISGAPTPVAQYGVQGPNPAANYTVGPAYGPKDQIPPDAIKATIRDPSSGKTLNGFTRIVNGQKQFRAFPGQ